MGKEECSQRQREAGEVRKSAEESGEAKFAIVHFHPDMTSHCLTLSDSLTDRGILQKPISIAHSDSEIQLMENLFKNCINLRVLSQIAELVVLLLYTS